jgi:hypothetical protein
MKRSAWERVQEQHQHLASYHGSQIQHKFWSLGLHGETLVTMPVVWEASTSFAITHSPRGSLTPRLLCDLLQPSVFSTVMA